MLKQPVSWKLNAIVANVVVLSAMLFFPPSATASAKEKYPAPDDVIASWSPKNVALPNAKEATALLAKATLVNGSPRLINEVNHAVNVAEQKGALSPAMLLLKARLQQQQHQFEEARKTLQTVLHQRPHYPSAKLLLATVYINLGNFDQAAQTCKSLITQTEYVVSFTCLLDAQFQQQPDKILYNKLNQIAVIRPSEDRNVNQWVQETLASMALQNGEPRVALAHLENIALATAPVSLVTLWADCYLALHEPRIILDTLASIINDSTNLDDAILLRLAMAEQQLNTSKKWQHAMAQRVAMREWRNDVAHAAQIAQYYLDVSANKEKALHFAKLNWQQAKSFADQQLLERASSL